MSFGWETLRGACNDYFSTRIRKFQCFNDVSSCSGTLRHVALSHISWIQDLIQITYPFQDFMSFICKMKMVITGLTTQNCCED